MNARHPALLFVLLIVLSACRDYGEFTVVEREWIDNDELPTLSEMDLRDINLEFTVYSEAHARMLPEAYWPDPIGNMVDRVKWQHGGQLPEDFDLPLPDACLYVTSDPQPSRFRRIAIGNRSLLLATYGIPIPESERTEEDRFLGRQRRPILTVIDENAWTRNDFELNQVGLDGLYVLDDRIVLLYRSHNSISFRVLSWIEDQPEVSDSIELFKSDTHIEKLVSRALDTDRIAFAWLTRSKYPPAKPGALSCEPLKAANTEPAVP